MWLNVVWMSQCIDVRTCNALQSCGVRMVHSVAGLREWSTLHSATTSCCSWCQVPSRGVYVHACKWELTVPCTCIYMRMWVYAYVLVGTHIRMPQLLIFYENVYICVVRLYYLLQALFGAVKCTYIVLSVCTSVMHCQLNFEFGHVVQDWFIILCPYVVQDWIIILCTV